jgi:serine/threonine protein kinase
VLSYVRVCVCVCVCVCVQEVRLLHKLAGHPHIAGINCWFEGKNGDFYLEMPFYPAGTLREWLTTERPEMHLRVVLRQLLLVLLHLSAHGVVHCDVKPENIFLESANPPFLKLGDFDVRKDSDARATATATHAAATIVGFTERNAAPELLERRPASPSSDVYAAGLVCLEMFFPDAARARTPGELPSLPAGAPDSPGLLRRWLAADPAARLTPAQILAHQFFEQAVQKLDALEKKLEGMEDAQQARYCCCFLSLSQFCYNSLKRFLYYSSIVNTINQSMLNSFISNVGDILFISLSWI